MERPAVMPPSILLAVEVPISLDTAAAIRKSALHELDGILELPQLISSVTEAVIRTIKSPTYEDLSMTEDVKNASLWSAPVPPIRHQECEGEKTSEEPSEQERRLPDSNHDPMLGTPSDALRTKMEASIIKAITERKTRNLLQEPLSSKEEATFFKMPEHKCLDFLHIQPVDGDNYHSGVFEITYEVYRRDCIVVDTGDLEDQLTDIQWKRCGDSYQDLDEANSAAVKELRRSQPDKPIIVSSSGLEVRQEESEDGAMYFCLEYGGVGLAEVVVLEKLLCAVDDGEVVNTEDDWGTLPAFFVKQCRATPINTEVVESGVVFLDLHMANEEAIKQWIDITWMFSPAAEKEVRLAGLLRRSHEESGYFKGKEGFLEVSVQAGRLAGPSAALRNQGLHKIATTA